MPSIRPAFALGAAATLVMLGAAPASAAPLPEGTILTAGWGSAAIYSASPTSGALTLVGPTDQYYFGGLDVDSATGEGFAVTYSTSPTTDPPTAALYSLDGTTGATVFIDTVTLGGDDVKGCTDLDYTAGVILVACDINGAESFIATVDPATAVATVVYPVIPRLNAIAVSPAGELYGVTFNNEVFLIDLVGGTYDDLGDTNVGIYVSGADFDQAGVLYISSARSMEPYVLATLDLTSLVGTVIGPLALDGAEVGAGQGDVSVTGTVPAVVPVATHPPTGYDAMPLALLTLALLAVGGVLLVTRRVLA